MLRERHRRGTKSNCIGCRKEHFKKGEPKDTNAEKPLECGGVREEASKSNMQQTNKSRREVWSCG